MKNIVQGIVGGENVRASSGAAKGVFTITGAVFLHEQVPGVPRSRAGEPELASPAPDAELPPESDAAPELELTPEPEPTPELPVLDPVLDVELEPEPAPELLDPDPPPEPDPAKPVFALSPPAEQLTTPKAATSSKYVRLDRMRISEGWPRVLAMGPDRSLNAAGGRNDLESESLNTFSRRAPFSAQFSRVAGRAC